MEAEVGQLTGRPFALALRLRWHSDMRTRKTLADAGYFLLAGLLIWFVVASVIGWFIDIPGARRQPREGEPCREIPPTGQVEFRQ